MGIGAFICFPGLGWCFYLGWPGILLGARSSVWLEHLAHNQVVVGSNPSGPTF